MEQKVRPRHTFGNGDKRALIGLFVTLIILFAALFGGAGTFDWPRGWLFFGVYCGFTAIACVWLWLTNPEIFAARSRMQAGTKSWDKTLTRAILLCYLTIFVVSALDGGRFRWAPAPDVVVIVGYLLFVAGFFGFTWAQSVNRHFEATVRIQTDREHTVIVTGPYAYVRHPGYGFAILMAFGMPLAMGSLYGVIPAGLMAILVLIRTLAEDATLKAELPGYREYAARVKHRWLPGVW